VVLPGECELKISKSETEKKLKIGIFDLPLFGNRKLYCFERFNKPHFKFLCRQEPNLWKTYF